MKKITAVLLILLLVPAVSFGKNKKEYPVKAIEAAELWNINRVLHISGIPEDKEKAESLYHRARLLLESVDIDEVMAVLYYEGSGMYMNIVSTYRNEMNSELQSIAKNIDDKHNYAYSQKIEDDEFFALKDLFNRLHEEEVPYEAMTLGRALLERIGDFDARSRRSRMGPTPEWYREKCGTNEVVFKKQDGDLHVNQPEGANKESGDLGLSLPKSCNIHYTIRSAAHPFIADIIEERELVKKNFRAVSLSKAYRKYLGLEVMLDEILEEMGGWEMHSSNTQEEIDALFQFDKNTIGKGL